MHLAAGPDGAGSGGTGKINRELLAPEQGIRVTGSGTPEHRIRDRIVRARRSLGRHERAVRAKSRRPRRGGAASRVRCVRASAAFGLSALALTQATGAAATAGRRRASALLIRVGAAGSLGILPEAAITASRASAGEPAALALFCSHVLVHSIARLALPAVTPPDSDYVHARREGKTPQPPPVLPLVAGCPDRSAPL